MNKLVRKAIIAGNWKMNKTPAEATELLSQITPLVKDADCDVIACVPYVDLHAALEATKGTNVKIGAENCHWAKFLLQCSRLWVSNMLSSVTQSADSTLVRQTRQLTRE